MKKSIKKFYSRPRTQTVAVKLEAFMIPISGQTTPSEADAKGAFFDFLIRDGVNARN